MRDAAEIDEYGTVRMRLYSMHKREFVIVCAAFVAIYLLAIFIGLAGPPITVTVKKSALSLQPPVNGSKLATGPYVIQTPALSSYSQQLWLIAKFYPENIDGQTFDKDFNMSVTFQGVENKKYADLLSVEGKAHNRSRHLHCSKQECDEFIVLHLGFLDYTHYIITLGFSGLSTIHKNYNIKDTVFFFKSYNTSFTQLEIWMRFTFLMVTFIVACWFSNSLRLYRLKDWSLEQKWLSVLLPLLLLHNDPSFPMQFLFNSWVPGMVDGLFQSLFLCALLMFWLCVYHGLRQNERGFCNFYLVKIVIVSLLWLTAFILAGWQEYNALRDPIYSYKLDSDHYNGIKTCFFIVCGIYVIYLLYLIVRAYSDLRSMPYFDIRLKFLTSWMVLVVGAVVVITVLRFGVGVLEDTFVAELSTTYSNSAEFMAFYALLNFYLFTMAYVYSPAVSDLTGEPQIVRDNPAFSMVNDSDEDVIYGSEDECRLPLNRGQGPDDSD